MARNRALNRLRASREVLALEEDVLCLAEDGPQRLLEEREQAELVRRALGELERPDRELFVRHYYYGQTVAGRPRRWGQPVHRQDPAPPGPGKAEGTFAESGVLC